MIISTPRRRDTSWPSSPEIINLVSSQDSDDSDDDEPILISDNRPILISDDEDDEEDDGEDDDDETLASLPNLRGDNLPPPRLRDGNHNIPLAIPEDHEPRFLLDDDPPLSPEQAAVLIKVLRAQNVFFTGPAGTGKSLLTRAIIKTLTHGILPPGVELPPELRGATLKRPCAVTASTGIAALNIGGRTVHSFAGIGTGKGDAMAIARNIVHGGSMSEVRHRWTDTDVLILDEISMIHAELLDKLNIIGQKVRKSLHPFGGMQLVFCGDFFQLPPVDTERRNKPHDAPLYAFDAHCWEDLFKRENIIMLKQVFRQSEGAFVSALSKMRRGQVTEKGDDLLRSCQRPTANIRNRVSLYPTRSLVENMNRNKLNTLQAEVHVYEARDFPGINAAGRPLTKHEATKLLNDHTRFVLHLELKIGAQVMLVTNWREFPGALVNGSTGKVIDMLTFAEAQAAGDITIPKDIPALHTGLQYPVVAFVQNRNGNPVPPKLLVPPLQFSITNFVGDQERMEASRTQVPLILAWALTIHKSQGLTLDNVQVNLENTFDSGQAYVAISRATCVDGLQLLGYTPSKIMTSRRVLAWEKEVNPNWEEEQNAAEEEDEDDIMLVEGGV